MQEAPDDPHIEESAPGIVAEDLPCARCGYNLRALPLDDKCPECGILVGNTLEGDWLRYADRRWAKQVLRGIQWTMLSRDAIAIALFLSLATVFTGLLVIPSGIDTPLERRFEFALSAIGVLMMLPPIGIAYGLWLASAPEPRETAEGEWKRLMTRTISILLVPAVCVWVTAERWAGPGTSLMAVHGTSTICFLIVWLHFFVVLHQVETIERRCQGRPTERISRVYTYVQCARLLPALLLLLHWLRPLLSRFFWTGPALPEPIGPFLMGLGWIVVTGMFTPTMKLMRSELTAAVHPRR